MRNAWLALVMLSCARATPSLPEARVAPPPARAEQAPKSAAKRISAAWELKRYGHSASYGVLVAAPDGGLLWASTGGLATEASAAPPREGTRASWLDPEGKELLSENVGPEGFFAVSACVGSGRELTVLGVSRVRMKAAADLVRISRNRRVKGWTRHYEGLYSGPVALTIADSGTMYVVLETSGELEIEGQRLVHPRYSRTGVPAHPVNAILAFDEAGVLRATLFQDFRVVHVTALGKDAAFVLDVKSALWLPSGQSIPAGRNLVVLGPALEYRWSAPLKTHVEGLVRGADSQLRVFERGATSSVQGEPRAGSLALARIDQDGKRLATRTLVDEGRLLLEPASREKRAAPRPPAWRCTDSLPHAWTANTRGELLALQAPLGGDDAETEQLRRYRVLDAEGRDLGAALVEGALRRSSAVLLDDGSIVESGWREFDPGLELVLRRYAALD